MAGSVNRVQLLGNLGQDPEVRYTLTGKTVATLSVATSDQWKDAAGERQERTEWHRVVLWDRLAEVAGQYLAKGSKAYLEGSLQTRKWTDKDGSERYRTEIRGDRLVMLGDGKQRDGEPRQRRSESQPSGSAPPDDFDDQVPF